jgi:hypothetical protein
MFNYRIVVAQAQLLKDIFSAKEKDYSEFRDLVQSYQGPYKLLSAWLFARDFQKPQVDDIVRHLDPYIRKGQLKPGEIIVSPSAVKIKNSEPFEEIVPFSDYIHAQFPVATKESKEPLKVQVEDVPVATGDGIKIYQINSADDGRRLVGKSTNFCIGYPGPNNMWQHYRSNQASTFFVVYDDNPPTSNQKIVAIDFTKNNILLTDIPNNTGQQLSNGMDWEDYSEYLTSKGVNLDATRINPETNEEEEIFQNKPVTPQEKLVSNLFNLTRNQGKYTPSLGLTPEDIKMWSTGKFQIRSDMENQTVIQADDKDPNYFYFRKNSRSTPVNLPTEEEIPGFSFTKEPMDNPSGDGRTLYSSITINTDETKTLLPKFIGMGWILPDSIFDYVIDLPDGKDIIIQYIDTGLKLPKQQLDKIKNVPSFIKSYVRKQLQAVERAGSTDLEFLEFADPSDLKIRNQVIDTLYSKYENQSYDDMNIYFENTPLEWYKVPQIGLFLTPKDDYIDFSDELAIKVALAKGMWFYLKQNPTLENALIYLHDSNAINSFKDKAIAEKYHPSFFEAPYFLGVWKKLWDKVPDSLKKLPELNQYKALGEYEPYGGSLLEPPLPGDNIESLYETAAINILAGNSQRAKLYGSKPEFRLYLIKNFNRLTEGVFKNINYVKIESENDEDGNDIETKTYSRHDQREKFLKQLSYAISPESLGNPEIFSAIIDNFKENELDYILSSFMNVPQVLDYFTEKINTFSEAYKVADFKFSNLFMKENPILRKITQNGFDVDDFIRVAYQPIYFIYSAYRWYPEIIDKISDEGFLKILNSQRDRNGIAQDYFNFFYEKRPNVIWALYEEGSRILTYEQRAFLTQKKKEMSQQPQEPIEEEPTTAFVKSIVKVANKLDSKNRYKLADKFTNILRKYNV